MQTSLHGVLASHFHNVVHAVAVYHHLVVDDELAAVIRVEREGVDAVVGHLDIPRDDQSDILAGLARNDHAIGDIFALNLSLLDAGTVVAAIVIPHVAQPRQQFAVHAYRLCHSRLDQRGAHGVALASVGTKGPEDEVRGLAHRNRTGILGRRYLWHGAVGGIVYAHRGVYASHAHCVAVGEDGGTDESGHIGQPVLYAHRLQTGQMLEHTTAEVFVVHTFRTAPGALCHRHKPWKELVPHAFGACYTLSP